MSNSIQQSIKNARKIVVKIGSNTLAKEDGTQNTEFMENFAHQCSDLIKQKSSVEQEIIFQKLNQCLEE